MLPNARSLLEKAPVVQGVCVGRQGSAENQCVNVEKRRWVRMMVIRAKLVICMEVVQMIGKIQYGIK